MEKYRLSEDAIDFHRKSSYCGIYSSAFQEPPKADKSREYPCSFTSRNRKEILPKIYQPWAEHSAGKVQHSRSYGLAGRMTKS